MLGFYDIVWNFNKIFSNTTSWIYIYIETDDPDQKKIVFQKTSGHHMILVGVVQLGVVVSCIKYKNNIKVTTIN